MADRSVIEAAKEHFGVIVEQQLQRVDRLKTADPWTNFATVKPIIIGIRGAAASSCAMLPSPNNF